MAISHHNALKAVFTRDRILVVVGIASISAAAWLSLVFRHGATTPLPMGTIMARSALRAWGVRDVAFTFAFWAIMMVAMMASSVMPLVLRFATIQRERAGQQDPLGRTGVFFLAYLVVWTAYSGLAAVGQWSLHSAALLSPMLVRTHPLVGGMLLLIAGVFQFTPLKDACLQRCRSPLGFFLHEWREGRRGAFVMGLKHGSTCVVCCWALMSLMFVVGVMNLLWMALLTVFVLVEKIAPGRRWVCRVSGGLLLAWGAWMLAGTLGAP
jgi:predicted metal-binding membrane protein